MANSIYLGGGIKSAFCGGNVKEIHLGTNKLFPSGGVFEDFLFLTYGKNFANYIDTPDVGNKSNQGSTNIAVASGSALGTNYFYNTNRNSGSLTWLIKTDNIFTYDFFMALSLNDTSYVTFEDENHNVLFRGAFLFSQAGPVGQWPTSIVFYDMSKSVFTASFSDYSLYNGGIYGRNANGFYGFCKTGNFSGWKHFALTLNGEELSLFYDGTLFVRASLPVLSSTKYLKFAFAKEGWTGNYTTKMTQIAIRKKIVYTDSFTPSLIPYNP